MRKILIALCVIAATTRLAASQQALHEHHAALDERGQRVMGFDQKATTHHFLLTHDGGRIAVTAHDAQDSTSIDRIRSHLRHIATMFGESNFEAPMLVHAKQPPGTAEMKKARSAITYTFEELDRGGSVRIVATSPRALSAVHEFLRFQIRDHGTGDPLTVK